VAGTGLASELISPAAAEGFFHTFSGWLMFVVAFAGLMVFQRLIAVRAEPGPGGLDRRARVGAG
jgi:hypothetical protein